MSKCFLGTGLLLLTVLCVALPAVAAAPPSAGCPAAVSSSTADFLSGLSTVPPVTLKGFTVCGNGCPAYGGTDLSCKGKLVGAACPGGSCMPFLSTTCPSSSAHCDCIPR